ncbi:MAG: hypothetical protein IIV23_04210 [Ruminococcus sp.]|nr:hypothetical protein [Ruminococcus sp.]
MINLLYEPLPNSIHADGEDYGILTDFREWLRFADMIADKDLTIEEKVWLSAEWLDDPPAVITRELVQAIFRFFRLWELIPEQNKAEDEETEDEPVPKPPVFDWKIDARYLLGDFRHYYGINLLTAELHWWEFQALFTALPDESMCSKRIAYRSTDLGKIKDNAERQRIARIQRQIALPFEIDDEMIGAMLWSEN